LKYMPVFIATVVALFALTATVWATRTVAELRSDLEACQQAKK